MASSSRAVRSTSPEAPLEKEVPPLPGPNVDWEQASPPAYPYLSLFGPSLCCPRYPRLELWSGYCESHGRALHRFCRDCLERQAPVLEWSAAAPAVEEPVFQPAPAVQPEPIIRAPENETPPAPKADYPRPPRNQIPKPQAIRQP